MARKTLVLLLLMALLVVPASAGEGYRTRHVLVITMDGTRLVETFGDPSHKLIPHLWNGLRPQGTIYTNFLNTGITVTRQGHSTIASGTWQRVPNGGPRLTRPTFFEYLREEKGLPAGAAWAIFGKAAYAFAPYSSFPVYGQAYAPESAIGLGEAEEGDEHVLAKVKEVFARDHPALTFINLGCTDHFGHGEDFGRYTQAVATADRVIAEIWAAAQADPEMHGTTTMIVTNDHGRHDDAHGGYRGHGDNCPGCQRLMFLAIGPDTKAGAVVTEPGTLIDICPTVGELLGFQTPLAEGRVLQEAFLNCQGLNQKQARTAVAKDALARLAQRDLTDVVATKLASRGADALGYDPAGAVACLGLIAASGGSPNRLALVKQWAANPAAPGDPVACAARARILTALAATGQDNRQAYLQSARDLRAKAASLEGAGNQAAQALVLNALAWGGQEASQACLERIKGFLARPENPDPLVLFLLADAAAALPRRTELGQAALLHLGLALSQQKEPGGLWSETTTSCLNLAAMSLLRQGGWLKGFQAVDKKQRGKEQDEVSLIPAILSSIPRPVYQDWLRNKAPRQLWFLAQRIWNGVKYLPFSMDRLGFAVDAQGGLGNTDDRAAAGGLLVARKAGGFSPGM